MLTPAYHSKGSEEGNMNMSMKTQFEDHTKRSLALNGFLSAHRLTKEAFLVACTRLYKSLCRSVCRSVGLSVGNTFPFLQVLSIFK